MYGTVRHLDFRFLLWISRRRASFVHLSPLADAFNVLSPSAPSKSECTSGLFKNQYLTTSGGFQQLVAQTNQRCSELLREAISPSRKRKMVQVLDDMSDAVCRVADLADCVRMLHPDDSYRMAASAACSEIGRLVEELNTIPDLYASALSAKCRSSEFKSATVDSEMDEIDRRVLNLLIADFELSGVQLQDAFRRAEFVESASSALTLGAEFVEASHTPILFRPIGGSMYDNTAFHLSHPLIDEPRSDLREASYRAFYAPLPGQERRLTDLMLMRHRMAECAGFSSFADRATLHSLAECSDRVNLFLGELCQFLSPLATRTAREHLLPLVLGRGTGPSPIKPAGVRLCPWDVGYALGRKRQTVHAEELLDYFSLGACMEGISQLAECLFGLRLRIESTEPGEVWHSSVIKVGVYSTGALYAASDSGSSGLIGLVYCDLLDRPGKPAQDCHYTIQGGRCLEDGQYQKPIITLQLTLASPPDSTHPPLLAPGQVENLFHEWGHALHSMLARTRYQHVTGTRCSTDLAEIPSTLFEHFALDPRVTKEYARHWRTGKAPGGSELAALERLAIGSCFGHSVELIQQATYAQFDQILHSGPPDSTVLPHRDSHSCDTLPASCRLLSHIQHFSGLSDWLFCDPEHLNAWPHRFSHLVGYGGRYYSYLMAKAGAQIIWEHCFAKDPWSTSNGALYATRVLRRGGEFQPTTLLSDLLSGGEPGSVQFDISPKKLANGFFSHVYESENAASSLFVRMFSPGLHQPRLTQ